MNKLDPTIWFYAVGISLTLLTLGSLAHWMRTNETEYRLQKSREIQKETWDLERERNLQALETQDRVLRQLLD